MTITNCSVVTEDEVLEDHEIVVESGRIVALQPSKSESIEDPGVIDAGGAYLIPGLIDVHADYIEHMAAPRPTAIMDFGLAIREAERELVAHGITTMFHSLAMYDFTEFAPSPMRAPEHTRALIKEIAETQSRPHLIRHRFHARFEVDNLGRVDELKSYITNHTVHLLSFMDHTPGQGQYRDLELYRKTLKAYRNISDDELVRVIEVSQSREKLTLEALSELAALAGEHGIAVASHDDDSIGKLDIVESIGASISEFPITLEVARAARERGLHTVAGAPNVLLGGSHSGNLSAAEAVADGSVDVLCSDYYPAALLHAVFQLHREHGLPLYETVRLVTANPARAVNVGSDLGSIAVGKIADLLIVEQVDGTPAVRVALVGGNIVYQSNYRDGEA
jgi:alpha-D-ribose 1-methylphosphonate 5-triphosphate diphosphatase